MDAKRVQFDELISSLRSDLTDQKVKLKNEEDTFIGLLKTKEGEIDKLLSVTAERVITNDYNARADGEARRALIWQIISGVVFVALVGFGVWVFSTIIDTEAVSIPKLVAKLAVTLVLGIVVKWATDQAASHRSEERRCRRLALALAAIGPYLKDLEVPQQNAIKESLSERLFGQIDDQNRSRFRNRSNQTEIVTLPKEIVPLLEKLVEIFAKKV